MILTGFTKVVLVNGCTGHETHHHHLTTIEQGAGIRVVLAELHGGKTLKVFLYDQEPA